MDTVRFGRVLGFGARSAAKTLIQAIDAAKAEDPLRTAPDAGGGDLKEAAPRRPVQPSAPAAPIGEPLFTSRNSTKVLQRRGVRAGAKQFHMLAVKPAMRLSGVIVLEVVGVFFGVFALYGFNTMWRAKSGWHSLAPHHREFVGGAVMLAIFGYFCISSFLRARRRERGR
jgi:hypothetical protein